MHNIRLSLFASIAAASFSILLVSYSSAIAGEGAADIEGKYRGLDGSTAEFLSDGTVIFTQGRQAIWTWTTYDGNRLKLEPGQGIPGNPPAAMCAYRLEGITLHITNCEYAMQLTRF